MRHLSVFYSSLSFSFGRSAFRSILGERKDDKDEDEKSDKNDNMSGLEKFILSNPETDEGR